MPIQYEDHRGGLTVNPPMVDEATGEVIGEAQVYEFREKHEFFRNEDPTDEETPVEVDDDAFNPDDRDPSFDERLYETFDTINTAEYDINPEFADEVARVDLGDSPEAITVQYLASQVFNGNLTGEEAFNQAVESGLDQDKLMFQFWQLKERFDG